MARYNDAILRQIQQAIDIVDLVGERVALKKSGKEFKGLCPFHGDKTPSLFVSPGKQIFKCFACGAGGDVFKFIQLSDRVEFPEAVRTLAGRANIELPVDRGQPHAASGPGKVALAEANKWAARKFHNWLNEPAGEPGRKYLVGRGFTETTIRRFGLGFAPPGWDNLLGEARREKLDPAVLIAAGLLMPSRREGAADRPYDTFRNRVIFPILDAADRVIGFGGRTLGDDVPKYLNTAETALFNKRRELYGLRWGRQTVADSETVCVVEGYTDVIMAHQAGHANVVATLGTALTEDHVRMLGRLAKRIVLIYDADEAGIKASDRALELFLAAGVDLAVGTMPEGMDPCDAIVAHGPEAFAEAVGSAVDALEFKWQAVSRQFRNADGTADRRAAAEAMITTLANASGYESIDPIRRGLMLDRLAELTRTSAEELNRMLAAQARRRRGSGRAREGGDPTGEPPGSPGQAQPAGRPRRAVDIAMAQVLGVLLAEPSYFDSIRQTLGPGDYVDANLRALAEPVFELAAAGELSLTALLRRVESPMLANLATELSERVTQLGELGPTLQNAVRAVEHERQLEQARQRAERIRSGQFTDEDWLALAKRPRDIRRGGGS